MARFGSGTHRNTQAIGIPRNFDLVVLRPAPDNFIFLVLVDFQWIWVAFLHADLPFSFKFQFLARFGSRKVKRFPNDFAWFCVKEPKKQAKTIENYPSVTLTRHLFNLNNLNLETLA